MMLIGFAGLAGAAFRGRKSAVALTGDRSWPWL